MQNQSNTALELRPMELVSKLMGLKGHPFGALKFFNEVTDLVGGKSTFNQFGGKVYKYMRLNYMNNIDYKTAIENRMKKEGLNPDLFQHEGHKWMKRYKNGEDLTTLGYHQADEHLDIELRRWYLIVYIVSGKQVFDVSYYDANFQPIDMATIKPLLRDKTSKKQTDVGLNGDSQVVYRNFKIESVRELSINGEVYTITE